MRTREIGYPVGETKKKQKKVKEEEKKVRKIVPRTSAYSTVSCLYH